VVRADFCRKAFYELGLDGQQGLPPKIPLFQKPEKYLAGKVIGQVA